MATEKECAALSATVCHRHGINEARASSLPLPAGWSVLTCATSNTDRLGFRSSAFVDSLGDMVLAFSGPDFIDEALAVSADFEELLTNMALDIGLASYADAMQQATQTYGRLRQWARDERRDMSRMRFTGHGMGGGIATVMAAWFDQPCTVFSQAPLRAVALSPSDFARAMHTIETLMGTADGAVKALQGFIRHPLEVLAQREQLRVTHWHVRGEVYAPLRSPVTAIRGREHAMDIGIRPPTMETALTLHDMNLLAALLYDPRLAVLCQESPDLLSLLIDREQGSDLIDTLLSDQHRAGLEAVSSLQRFVNGLEWSGEVPAKGDATPATSG